MAGSLKIVREEEKGKKYFFLGQEKIADKFFFSFSETPCCVDCLCLSVTAVSLANTLRLKIN